MNRRGLFKGGAGAAAAMALSGRGGSQGPQPQPPTTPYPDANYTRQAVEVASKGLDLLPDPLHELKQLWVKNAQLEREKLCQQLERKQASLARMKSVSEAYKFHMIDVYAKERQTINTRFEDLVNKVWGGPTQRG